MILWLANASCLLMSRWCGNLRPESALTGHFSHLVILIHLSSPPLSLSLSEEGKILRGRRKKKKKTTIEAGELAAPSRQQIGVFLSHEPRARKMNPSIRGHTPDN